MTRRPRLLLATGALAAALALTSCSTFTDDDLAARVGDEELTHDEFAAILESDLAATILRGSPVSDGLADGAGARSLLSFWVLITSIDEAGLLPEELIQEATPGAAETFGSTWAAGPPTLQRLAAVDRAIGIAVQEGTVTEEQLFGAVDAADIAVDSRYGSWDAERYGIGPLG